MISRGWYVTASRDPERRERRASWYRSAMEQVERLDRLVDSILASVRVGPEQPADLQPTDVGVVVRAVVKELAPLLGHHRLEVHGRLRLQALTDAARLRQILEHLLENTVKYAPPATAIEIEWQLVEGGVRISVSDEGPGIPEEWRERIFEPYARRETRTARGSGIGLYAARRLAGSMGARLWCEPAKGGGARFVVSLPAAAAV